jgi:hypothetical protein
VCRGEVGAILPDELQGLPEGTEFQDDAIAQFLARRLLVELPEES